MWLLAVWCRMTTQPGVEIVRWSWPVTGSLGSAGLLAGGGQVALHCEAVSEEQKRQGGWQCRGQVTRGKERPAVSPGPAASVALRGRVMLTWFPASPEVTQPQ